MNNDPNQAPNTPLQPESQPTNIPPVDQPATPVIPVEVQASPVASTPQEVPQTPQPVVVQPTGGSKALAIWSLVLSIIAFITLLIFFISGPLALIALILGIIALVKHKPGKGLSIAGIVISGLTLLALPFAMAITLVALNGIQEKAKQNLESSQQRSE